MKEDKSKEKEDMAANKPRIKPRKKRTNYIKRAKNCKKNKNFKFQF
jgi:hypothetical protein